MSRWGRQPIRTKNDPFRVCILFDELSGGGAARVSPQHPEWHLTIWGEGLSRPELEAQARKLGIAERVALPGVTQEPFARLADADLFVLSSRVEGFPMALCEAMAVGLPVIATDVGAVSEILRDGLDGLLVPPNDVDALAAAIDRLMSAPEERRRLASCAPAVLERFSLEKVSSLWEEVSSLFALWWWELGDRAMFWRHRVCEPCPL